MAERGREWYHETSAGSPDTRRKRTVKKKNSPSLIQLETVLANAGTGGAAGYHASRTAFKRTRALAIALALVAAGTYFRAYGNPDVNSSLAMAVVLISFVGSFMLNAALWAGFRRYRLVQHKVRLVRRALTCASKENILGADDWGYDLKELGEALASTARSAALDREMVEDSINDRDQRRSARLKNVLSDLMAAGHTVELALRRKENATDRAWDSPFRWPGEDYNRRYEVGFLEGKRPTCPLPPRPIRLTARHV